MAPDGNKAKRLLLVNHTAKTIYHHHVSHKHYIMINQTDLVDSSNTYSDISHCI